MKKIFITIGMFLVLMFGFAINVQAESMENVILDKEIGINLEDEETIMKYDAITGETTEVDMEELRQLLEEKRENETMSNSSYNTNKFKYSLKTIQPLETRTTYNMQKAAPTGQLLLNSICRVKSSGGRGSAALVGKKLALTAAHCAVNGKTGEYYSNFTVYPGFTGDENVALQSGWSAIYFPKSWTQVGDGFKINFDWAILVLEKDLGSAGNYFDVKVPSNSDLNGKFVNLLGYPTEGGFNGNSVRRSGGTVNDVRINFFKYSSICYAGFSGGPIIDANSTIVGVHSGKDPDTGSAEGVRILSQMKDIIDSMQ